MFLFLPAKDVNMDKNTWIGLTAAAFCLVIALASPGEAGKNDLDSLEKATMQIHDDAMRAMADMNRTGRALKREMETLDSLAPRRDSIRQVVRRMKIAEEDMYAWMQAYTPPKEMPAEKAVPYLLDQKEKIGKNQQDILAALEAGRALLNRSKSEIQHPK